MAEASIGEIMIHTGQHYDHSMSSGFFDELDLSRPAYHLQIGSGTHGYQTALMLMKLEEILLDRQPNAVLIYGDTNSTLAGALAASKLHIPIIHVEAGLRSFNRKMPEEINRVLADHLSSLLFCPTPLAIENLKSEGIERGVHLVGDVMKDAVDLWAGKQSRLEEVLARFGVVSKQYFLATVHRAENTDDASRFNSIVQGLNNLELPVLLPAHPRTLPGLKLALRGSPGAVRLVDPVGYAEMLALTSGALGVLTDSGGLQKEAYMLGTPCITLRDETEWVETVAAGWNTLVGADSTRIRAAVRNLSRPANQPELYGDGKASKSIVDIVLRSFA
jgi:UDP-N-acetylglucosamine 2-epimerase